MRSSDLHRGGGVVDRGRQGLLGDVDELAEAEADVLESSSAPGAGRRAPAPRADVRSVGAVPVVAPDLGQRCARRDELAHGRGRAGSGSPWRRGQVDQVVLVDGDDAPPAIARW